MPSRTLETLRAWARALQRKSVTLWFACHHPQMPLFAKVWALFVVLYALSPIDLIPDFIPILGYLDELLLLPGLIWLALRLTPVAIRDVCQRQADEWLAARRTRPSNKVGALLVVALWLLMGYLGWQWASGAFA